MKAKIFLLSLLAVLAVGCVQKNKAQTEEKTKIIFETDIGNDVDDALAMDMLYKYIENDDIDVLAIMINKNGRASAEFTDILNCWYGHTDIPIGVIRDGADCETDAINYAQAVCNLKNDKGEALFERSLTSYSDLPDAHKLYRKILAEQEDKSVTIVSVGFSTNLARLMETPADEYSDLDGCKLVDDKVKLLVTMAGCFNNPDLHEYNVVKDVDAARLVFEEWPSPIVTSPFEVGIQILYPATSIENDFSWAGPHPVIEAYKSYQPMPYDRPTWDLTALLYAVEGDSMFTISPAGYIRVFDNGGTSFEANPEGNRYFLTTDQQQSAAISDHFVQMISTSPKNR